MRSINRSASLSLARDNNPDNHDDDPSPAASALATPAILSANDNAAVVEPLRLVRNPVPIHDALASVFNIKPEHVERRARALRDGDNPNAIRTANGKIVNYEGAIEALALASLGRDAACVELTTPPTTPEEVVKYGWGSYPPTVDDVDKAIAIREGRAQYVEAGRAKMSEAGKRGAAIRHGKAPKGSAKSADPDYDGRKAAAEAIGTTEYFTKEVLALPEDLYVCIRETRAGRPMPDKRLGYLQDARKIRKRYPESREDRLGFLVSWNKAREKHATLAVEKHFPTYDGERRNKLYTGPRKEPKDVRGDGYTLLFGDLVVRGAEVDAESIDIVFADILYDDAHRVPHARLVATHAACTLIPGRYFVLCAGNYQWADAVQAVCETGAFEDPRVVYVNYVGAKASEPQGIAFFVFRKKLAGTGCPAIICRSFVSEAQNNGETQGSPWQKNPKVLAEIFKALIPGATRLRISDPCLGWGSTGVAARRLGHEFVGIEVSNEGRRFEHAEREIGKARKGVWPKPVDPKTVKGKTGKSAMAKTNGKAHK
jgi:hypothetical protein